MCLGRWGGLPRRLDGHLFPDDLGKVADAFDATPSAYSGAMQPAISTARRVLPAPPAPVSVTSRLSANSFRTSAICAPRPTKLVSCAGRLCAPTLLGVRNGGKSFRRSAWHSCTTGSCRGRSRSGWVPRWLVSNGLCGVGGNRAAVVRAVAADVDVMWIRSVDVSAH